MGLFAAKIIVPLLAEYLSLPSRIKTSTAVTVVHRHMTKRKAKDFVPFSVEHSNSRVIDNIKARKHVRVRVINNIKARSCVYAHERTIL